MSENFIQPANINRLRPIAIITILFAIIIRLGIWGGLPDQEDSISRS